MTQYPPVSCEAPPLSLTQQTAHPLLNCTLYTWWVLSRPTLSFDLLLLLLPSHTVDIFLSSHFSTFSSSPYLVHYVVSPQSTDCQPSNIPPTDLYPPHIPTFLFPHRHCNTKSNNTITHLCHLTSFQPLPLSPKRNVFPNHWWKSRNEEVRSVLSPVLIPHLFFIYHCFWY